MKILMLGGTGAIGRGIVEKLSNKKHNIFITSRTARTNYGNVIYLKGNARDEDFLNSILIDKYDVILDFMVYKTDDFSSVYESLLNATKNYVFFSSSRVFADFDEKITENSPKLLDVVNDEEYLATDEYALTKARQERILESSKYDNYLIVRPYITFDPYRLQLGTFEKEIWLRRILQGKTLVFSKKMYDTFTTLTYASDFADKLSYLIENEIFNSKSLNITTDEFIKWSEVADIYFDEITKNKGLDVKLKLIDSIECLSSRKGKYQVIYDRLYDRLFDNSKVKSLTNNEFSDVKESLIFCVNKFLQEPLFLNVNWLLEAKMDRITKDCSKFSDIPGLKQKVKYYLFRYSPMFFVNFLEKVYFK